jgi:hypothetical protein
MEEVAAEEGYKPLTDFIEVANEFAYVLLRKVQTRNGVRIEIYSPKLGYRTYLDPLQLESITWAPEEVFDKFLETPLGPN